MSLLPVLKYIPLLLFNITFYTSLSPTHVHSLSFLCPSLLFPLSLNYHFFLSSSPTTTCKLFSFSSHFLFYFSFYPPSIIRSIFSLSHSFSVFHASSLFPPHYIIITFFSHRFSFAPPFALYYVPPLLLCLLLFTILFLSQHIYSTFTSSSFCFSFFSFHLYFFITLSLYIYKYFFFFSSPCSYFIFLLVLFVPFLFFTPLSLRISFSFLYFLLRFLLFFFIATKFLSSLFSNPLIYHSIYISTQFFFFFCSNNLSTFFILSFLLANFFVPLISSLLSQTSTSSFIDCSISYGTKFNMRLTTIHAKFKYTPPHPPNLRRFSFVRRRETREKKILQKSIDDLQKRCDSQYFGYKCKFRCHCKEDEPCEKLVGHCDSGCKDGYWGPGCQLENKCYYNGKIDQYMGTKSVTVNLYTCQRWDSQHPHKHTYRPHSFVDKIYPENYCRTTPDTERNWCYTSDRKMRWDYCNVKDCRCPQGRFGENCAKECHCKEADEVCDSVLGMCKSGCALGWTNYDCQTVTEDNTDIIGTFICHVYFSSS
ncbi:unnamed protein product [Acanthosepion pharaonis]|uniref:Kringle domain-containing protein n=1 Tax=Acanthosepion pharaonis TaxID=158019 RepID=A0A812CJW7_ACAPH|nr:unnamed protein product [Sepia pharaonis]